MYNALNDTKRPKKCTSLLWKAETLHHHHHCHRQAKSQPSTCMHSCRKRMHDDDADAREKNSDTEKNAKCWMMHERIAVSHKFAERCCGFGWIVANEHRTNTEYSLSLSLTHAPPHTHFEQSTNLLLLVQYFLLVFSRSFACARSFVAFAKIYYTLCNAVAVFLFSCKCFFFLLRVVSFGRSECVYVWCPY